MIVRSRKLSGGRHLEESGRRTDAKSVRRNVYADVKGLNHPLLWEVAGGECLHINYNPIQQILSGYIEDGSQSHNRCQYEAKPRCPLAGVINRV